jgi:hypothetical protein
VTSEVRAAPQKVKRERIRTDPSRPSLALSRSNASRADALEAGCEIRVWLDQREIDYCENIILKIADGLDAVFVLLILSPDPVDWKWVKEEWTDTYLERVERQHFL